MQYKGKLYGKVGNGYFPLSLTADEVDDMDERCLRLLMPKEMADLFMAEINQSLNEITFNGERKIIAIRKYGNSIAVTLEPYGKLPKEAYNFRLATKQAEVIMDSKLQIEK